MLLCICVSAHPPPKTKCRTTALPPLSPRTPTAVGRSRVAFVVGTDSGSFACGASNPSDLSSAGGQTGSSRRVPQIKGLAPTGPRGRKPRSGLDGDEERRENGNWATGQAEGNLQAWHQAGSANRTPTAAYTHSGCPTAGVIPPTGSD